MHNKRPWAPVLPLSLPGGTAAANRPLPGQANFFAGGGERGGRGEQVTGFFYEQEGEAIADARQRRIGVADGAGGGVVGLERRERGERGDGGKKALVGEEEKTGRQTPQKSWM